MEEKNVPVGKLEIKRLLGRRRRCRWKDGIEMYLREIAWGGIDWIDLAEDRDQWKVVVNTVINLWAL
jgi:hypothetical protein